MVVLIGSAICGLSFCVDWAFCISDPAVDLAHTINDYLVFGPQSKLVLSPHLWEQAMDVALQAYQAIRPLNQERIKTCHVFNLFGR